MIFIKVQLNGAFLWCDPDQDQFISKIDHSDHRVHQRHR